MTFCREDMEIRDYNYTKEYYDNFVKILYLFRNDIRKQAEFLNVTTNDWGLRLCYPDLPVMMFDYFNKLEYMKFDECSDDNKKKILNFFMCQRCLDDETNMSEKDIAKTKELHQQWKLMPW